VLEHRAWAIVRARSFRGDRKDITGIWHGVSSYPGIEPSEEFAAELSVTDGRITGMITEVSNLVPNAPLPLRASVEGTFRDGAVAFDKTYDGGGDQNHSVHYWGRLNAEGTEITGNWQLPGLEGSFVMRRASEEREAVKLLTPRGAR
jgi:hypothetical protein